jgi:carbon monoxide dehydrogenase subunit G
VDISGNYLFDAPQDRVWAALLDPNVLGSIMPGGKGFEQTGENQYKGVLEVKVGPVQGTFQGNINLSDIVAPEHYKIEVDGKGAPGFVKANGSLRLETRGSQTYMEYSGSAQIGGRIASVGQRLMDSAARSIIRQSLEALNEYLQVQVAQQQAVPAGVAIGAWPASSGVASPAAPPSVSPSPPVQPPATPISAYKPPSQMSLGFNVAKDVFNDFVPAKYQPLVFAAIIIVILLIIWLIVRR